MISGRPGLLSYVYDGWDSVSYLKLALSQMHLSAKRYFPEWFLERALGFFQRWFITNYCGFLWTRCLLGYLKVFGAMCLRVIYLPDRLSLLPKFPTGDLTAIDGRGPTWAKWPHLLSRFSWELTPGNKTFQTGSWSKVWVQPALLSSICKEHFYVLLAFIFISLRSSWIYPFHRLERCGQGGWVICQRTQINRRSGLNKTFWFSSTQ